MNYGVHRYIVITTLQQMHIITKETFQVLMISIFSMMYPYFALSVRVKVILNFSGVLLYYVTLYVLFILGSRN